MIPRVAFFTDSFHEANGVALTSREFAAFAGDRMAMAQKQQIESEIVLQAEQRPAQTQFERFKASAHQVERLRSGVDGEEWRWLSLCACTDSPKPLGRRTRS
jgi:hypothetical protein